MLLMDPCPYSYSHRLCNDSVDAVRFFPMRPDQQTLRTQNTRKLHQCWGLHADPLHLPRCVGRTRSGFANAISVAVQLIDNWEMNG